MSLPASIYDMVEFSPLEDFIVPLLQGLIPDVPVKSEIEEGQTFPVILARRDASFGFWDGDHRFFDQAPLIINTYVSGPDADQDAALLADAVRAQLFRAWREQIVIPGRGHIVRLRMTSPPRRAPDWASPTGPVQYAELPRDVERYETRYTVTIRKPRVLATFQP